eukprot:3941946-Rhodomonas_salina.4
MRMGLGADIANANGADIVNANGADRAADSLSSESHAQLDDQDGASGGGGGRGRGEIELRDGLKGSRRPHSAREGGREGRGEGGKDYLRENVLEIRRREKRDEEAEREEREQARTEREQQQQHVKQRVLRLLCLQTHPLFR